MKYIGGHSIKLCGKKELVTGRNHRKTEDQEDRAVQCDNEHHTGNCELAERCYLILDKPVVAARSMLSRSRPQVGVKDGGVRQGSSSIRSLG